MASVGRYDASWSLCINRFTLSTNSQPVAEKLEDWISQAEAARLRGVTRQAIGKLVAHGRLRTLEAGGRALVSRSEVLSYEPKPAGRPKGERE